MNDGWCYDPVGAIPVDFGPVQPVATETSYQEMKQVVNQIAEETQTSADLVRENLRAEASQSAMNKEMTPALREAFEKYQREMAQDEGELTQDELLDLFLQDIWENNS